MDNLNRTDRRELIKKAKKKSEFAKKLTPLQKEYINDLVQAGVERTRVKLLDTFDLCVQGALIETTNLTYEDIGKVVYKAGELMKESYDILENMSLEERRMSVKSIKNEVAEKITKMIFIFQLILFSFYHIVFPNIIIMITISITCSYCSFHFGNWT